MSDDGSSGEVSQPSWISSGDNGDLSEPAELTAMCGKVRIVTTTTTYTKVVVQEEVLEGGLVVDSVIDERDLEPVVVVTEKSLDYARTVPEQGPIAPEGSELFKGKTFIITQGPPMTTSIETPPLDKVHLKSQITAGGGVVLADLTEEIYTKTNISECFLISDTHSRTTKYMSALSVAIPCVSHLWIINCCKQAKLLNCEEFMLPAGYSSIMEEIILWHGRKQMFGGLSFALVFDANANWDCVQCLSQVLTLGGGQIVTEKNSFDWMDINVIVADNGLEAPDKEYLLLLGKPIVTKQWVFHCLIHGCKLEFAAHPKFSISL